MSNYEELSRLLDGDLPADEARRLKARIQTEPDLAERWRALLDLSTALGELPDIEPPAELNMQVMGRRAPAAPSLAPRAPMAMPPRLVWLASLAACALAPAAFFVGRSSGPVVFSEPQELILFEGSQLVDGAVDVLVPGALIEVRGKASIFVEPAGTPVRSDGPEVKTMNKTTVLAAVVGAVVTVAVYEGSAMIFGNGDEALQVDAGEQWRNDGSVAAGEEKAPKPLIRRLRVGPGGGDVEARGDGGELGQLSRPELVALVQAMEQKIADLSTDRALAENRVAALEGVEQPWPDNLPPGYSADEIDTNLRAAVGAEEGVALLELNCDEYPCIAVLDFPPDIDQEALQAMTERITGAVYPEDGNTMVMIGKTDGPDGLKTTAVLASSPEGNEPDGLRERTGFRAREAMDSYEPAAD